MRIKKLLVHASQAVLEGALVAMLVVGLAAGTALAAKGGGGGHNGGSSTTSGICAVTPDPVAVGADYTLAGANLGAGTLVNIMIADPNSTSSWNLQADAAGTVELVWHAYWPGTSNVKFQTANKHHGWTTVATCSFQVD